MLGNDYISEPAPVESYRHQIKGLARYTDIVPSANMGTLVI